VTQPAPTPRVNTPKLWGWVNNKQDVLQKLNLNHCDSGCPSPLPARCLGLLSVVNYTVEFSNSVGQFGPNGSRLGEGKEDGGIGACGVSWDSVGTRWFG
jgi:hypothetical protein